jgi:hypothetical protein
MERIRKTLAEEGVVVLHGDDMPIDDATWDGIHRALRELPYEEVRIGDAGDKHKVRVSRLVNDHDVPTFLQPSAQAIITAVMGERMMALCREALGLSACCVRRSQAHLLSDGGFIGPHVDQDSNPDYRYAVVLHFDHGFTGGELIASHSTKGRRAYRPAPRSILINRGDIPHEVTPVEQGERMTLALFLSDNAGPRRASARAS